MWPQCLCVQCASGFVVEKTVASFAVLEVVYFQDFVILQCSIVHGLFIHIYGRHNGMLNNYKIVLKLYIKETDTIDFIEYV